MELAGVRAKPLEQDCNHLSADMSQGSRVSSNAPAYQKDLRGQYRQLALLHKHENDRARRMSCTSATAEFRVCTGCPLAVYIS